MSHIRVDHAGLKTAADALRQASGKNAAAAGELTRAGQTAQGSLGEPNSEEALHLFIHRLTSHLGLHSEMLGELSSKMRHAAEHYRSQDHKAARRFDRVANSGRP